MQKESPRIGVYICHCGGNISDTVDVAKVKEAIAKIKGVEIANTYEYVCSNPGQEMIKEGIREHGINKIVVAACSPRMHLETFRKTVESEGLNPYLLEAANIREQVSWAHENKDEATKKAIDIVLGAVGRAQYLEPLESMKMEVNKDVLVIGGGIAGIMASLDLADQGYQVYLVEANATIGGRMAQLGKTFPTLDCSQCILTPKMVSAGQRPRIKIIDMATLYAVSGSPGNYTVSIKVRPRYVNMTCISCGECARVCPVKVPNEFDEGLTQRKAIYLPFKQAVPNAYLIDTKNCLYFQKGVCKLCQRFCKSNSVDFEQKEKEIKLDVGAIVVATGFDLIEPNIQGQYNFGLHPDIVTNLQFERLTMLGLQKPSNKAIPKKIAFILCVGSRSNSERGVESCCQVGCMIAIKEAYIFQKAVTNADPWIFYTDVRAAGKGYEEFYAYARNHNVKFIRGRVAEVVPDGDSLLVKADDTLLGMPIESHFDMVVLSPALIPRSGAQELAQILNISTGSEGFILERHFKLRPVDSQREGIFACGCTLGPKDIRETTLEAMATASKVATFLGKGELLVSPEKAYIIPEKCNLCKVCVEVCPVNAVETDHDKVTVNSISCIGCGICVVKCPTEAIELKHSTEDQLTAQIRGVSEGDGFLKILAFLESKTAYASLDQAGQSRLSYPSNVRVIGVPSTGRIGIKHLLIAFAAGADGIIFVEGDDSVFTEEKLRNHVEDLKKKLRDYGIEPLRLISTTTTIPQYDKILALFNMFNGRLSKMGRIKAEKRKEIENKLSGK